MYRQNQRNCLIFFSRQQTFLEHLVQPNCKPWNQQHNWEWRPVLQCVVTLCYAQTACAEFGWGGEDGVKGCGGGEKIGFPNSLTPHMFVVCWRLCTCCSPLRTWTLTDDSQIAKPTTCYWNLYHSWLTWWLTYGICVSRGQGDSCQENCAAHLFGFCLGTERDRFGDEQSWFLEMDPEAVRVKVVNSFTMLEDKCYPTQKTSSSVIHSSGMQNPMSPTRTKSNHWASKIRWKCFWSGSAQE